MKLLYSPGSPYARKVRIVLREKGLAQRVEEVAADPHRNPDELLRLNPLAKVPVLNGDDGPVFDSPLICEYLERLVPRPPLLPAAARERLGVQRLQALADGIMDAAVASVLEARRADAAASAHWLARWEAAIRRAVGALAAASLPATIRLDGIAAGCALAYLDFRLPAIDWRGAYPPLAQWLDQYADRPSFHETAPA